MTPAEVRAGLIRLGVVLTIILGLSAAAAAIWGSSRHLAFRRQFAAVLALDAVGLLLVGIVAWRRAFPVQRPRRGDTGGLRVLSKDERRGGEAQAIGIILLGLGFFAASLLLG